MDTKKLEDLLLSISGVCADLEPTLCNLSSSVQCKESEVVLIATGIQQIKVIVNGVNHFIEEADRYEGHLDKMQQRFANLQNSADIVLKTVESGIVLVVPELKHLETVNKTMGPVSNPKRPTSDEIPHISHLDDEELAKIPNYMKGRLKLSELNSFIDKFNKTVDVKYRLLKKPRKQLSENEKKQFNAYKALERKDTIGCYFCTSDDIRDIAGQKFIHSTWAMFTILRHCNRLKEIRGPNQIVRYCVNVTE